MRILHPLIANPVRTLAWTWAAIALGAAPAWAGQLLLSSRDRSLAVNAWGGATHGGELRLHNGCRPDNPDCTWTFSGGMLISDRRGSGPPLAIMAWGGARFGAELRLSNSCRSDNPDCTWTYRNGMFVSNRDPSLAINAWGGARYGTPLKLHNGCRPENPDCTWAR